MLPTCLSSFPFQAGSGPPGPAGERGRIGPLGRKVCLKEHWASATKAALKSCWILHGLKEIHEINLLSLHSEERSNSVLIVSAGSHFSEQKGKNNRATEIPKQLSWADSQKMHM